MSMNVSICSHPHIHRTEVETGLELRSNCVHH